MIQQKEYARRRRQLMRMMGADSIAILPAAALQHRNRDSEYPYRQDSDFQYLTGFPEPEACAVLIPGRLQGEYIVFCRERDPLMEIWTGPRAGPEGACERYGADDAFPIADIDDILPGLLEGKERLFYSMGYRPEFDQRVLAWVNRIRAQGRRGVQAPAEFVALEHLLHELRLYKSPAEIKLMRKAARIAATAHTRAMQMCRPGVMEYQLEAELLHEFRRHGAWVSYNPIVGGGSNSCILHYTDNNAVLKDGDVILIDAGAEFQCYASDITRTFPINGRFSREQRAVYEVVLAAQQAAISEAIPGKHWNDPHDAAVRVLTEGMVRLGLLKGKIKELIRRESYRRFYMHRTGHWLGMDVHDVGEYKVANQWRVLEPGMVLTVEPGLYIPKARSIPKRYWNIGVRIEDDVLIARGGCEVLSSAVCKEVDEIEALMERGRAKYA